MELTRFRVLDSELDPADVFAFVRDDACGAIATFVGTVRRTHGEKEVLRLEYEVHESMATRQMARLAESLRKQHGVTRIAIDHRRGIVPVGGVSVCIAVSSPHRRASLAACAEAIEILKADVPIWKKEVFPDGHEWRTGS